MEKRIKTAQVNLRLEPALKEAAEKAARAARQARHAVNNAGGAAEAMAEHAKDEIVESAEETKSGLKTFAHTLIYTESGRGTLAIGLGLLSIGFGVRKLQKAALLGETLRSELIRNRTI